MHDIYYIIFSKRLLIMQCTQVLSFDSAHRIVGHSGKCRMLHGHRYVLEATFQSDILNDLGMVIDFGEIKQKLKKWINNNWDHNVILYNRDKKLGTYISEITGQKIFYLQNNPTAENMASYLLITICPSIFKENKIKCIKIKLYETPNCYVTVWK